MIIRGLDSNDDWTFGRGIQNYLKNLDAVLLNIKTRLKSWKYDCFFAPAEDVDWNNYLDIGTKSFLDADIKRVILQSEGVLKVTGYESTLDRDSRALSVECTINTIYGNIDFNEVL
jgi:hypothetical protein